MTIPLEKRKQTSGFGAMVKSIKNRFGREEMEL